MPPEAGSDGGLSYVIIWKPTSHSPALSCLFLALPFHILHKVPTKPAWAGSTAQLSNAAHKLIQSCSAMYLCKMVFFLHAHRSSPAGISCGPQTPILAGLCWCSSFPWVSGYARCCFFSVSLERLFSFSSTSHLFLPSFVLSFRHLSFKAANYLSRHPQILLLVSLNAVHLLWGALFSTWVVLLQIVHCRVALTRSDVGILTATPSLSSTTFLAGGMQTDGNDNNLPHINQMHNVPAWLKYAVVAKSTLVWPVDTDVSQHHLCYTINTVFVKVSTETWAFKCSILEHDTNNSF